MSQTELIDGLPFPAKGIAALINSERGRGFQATYVHIQADVFSESIAVFSNTVDTATIDQNNLESITGVGLDLAVMYRITDWQFGGTVKNVNAPSFEHSNGYVYEMNPQAKIGVAWMPSNEFTLEAGLDLTENQGALETNKTKYWNVGLEWDAWKVLAIRLGSYQNMADDSVGMVNTLGLGLNLWAARLDIAAAMSSKEITLNDNGTEETIPTYLSASAALTIDF